MLFGCLEPWHLIFLFFEVATKGGKEYELGMLDKSIRGGGGTLICLSSSQIESSVCKGEVWTTLGYVGFKSQTHDVSTRSLPSLCLHSPCLQK